MKKSLTQSARIRAWVGAGLSLLMTGCGTFAPLPQPPADDPEQLEAAYRAAVADAEIATTDEISRDLVAITPDNDDLEWQGSGDNRRVLVVTWTSWDGYDDLVGTETELGVDVWVTVVPEVRDFCDAAALRQDDLTLRLEQLLGLPPSNGKDRFVELWVSPMDLFRPSADPAISDHEAELDFPISNAFVTVSEAHQEWIEDLEAQSYGPDGYPWTRLGYTYDWGNPHSEVGLSEFVIREGATVGVNSVETTSAYCR
jgi:hypothetical protein